MLYLQYQPCGTKSDDFVSRHAKTQSGVSMHMTKQTHKSTPIKVTFIMFSLQRTQQHSKATCPLEFIFQVLSSLPKRALSSLLYISCRQNKTEREKKQAWMGGSTQNIVLGWGVGRLKVTTYSETPRGILPAHFSAQHRTLSQVWWLLLWLEKRKGKKVGSPCWIW